jgi:hypothetical protein
MTTPSDFDSGGTPGTTPDPETTAEGDSDQLEFSDTLLDRGVDSPLDEGYSPAERPPGYRLETHLDQALGEPMDAKLAAEEPDVGEPGARRPDAADPDRAGRLTAADPDADGLPSADTMAVDAGLAGGAASAEEAAMHVVDEDGPRRAEDPLY